MSETESVSDIEFELSSGNVYADLGFENAEEMLAKSDLVSEIEGVMKRRRIGAAAVAKALGIPRREVFPMRCGDFEHIPIETLQRGLETLQKKGQKGKKALRRRPGSGYSGGQSGGSGGGEPLAAAGRE